MSRRIPTEAPPLGERQRLLPEPDLTVHPVGRNATRTPGLLQVRLLRHFGLTPSTDLLEIGCGVGRLVYELADVLTQGSYLGFDIAESAIAWLREHYAPRLANFRFELVKAGNRRYNPHEKRGAARVAFPCGDSSHDMVCAFSVFTHMQPEDIEHYLVEVRRVLRPSGRGVLTFFAVGAADHSPALAHETFVPLPGAARTWTTSPEVPERAIAFGEDYVLEMIARARLRVADRVLGRWHRRGAGENDPVPATAGPAFHKDVFVVERA